MLVIGASGFIGGHVRVAAEDAGFEVIGASRRDPEHACDLSDSESVDELIRAVDPGVVINAAGPPSVARSWKHPAETADIHATGALRLLVAVQQHAPRAHLILLSSAEVYGSSEHPFGETDPISPLTPYGAAKAAMEIYCEQFARAHGLPTAVVRPFNQIGPGLAPGHAIADFVDAVVAAERLGKAELELAIGNAGAIRDYTDVGDAAEAVLGIARQGATGTFNICSGQGVSIEELVGALDKISTVALHARVDESLVRPGDPKQKVGIRDLITQETGWVPRRPLTQTLGAMLDSSRAADTRARSAALRGCGPSK